VLVGANDVYENNPNETLMVKYSHVHRAIQVFHYKLKEVTNSFNYVIVMKCNYNREYLTKNGMHLNRKGKGLVSKQLASEIWNLSLTEEISPKLCFVVLSASNRNEYQKHKINNVSGE
jgi:hypothetical protein